MLNDQGTEDLVPNSYLVYLDNDYQNPWKHAGKANEIHDEDPAGLPGVQEVYNWDKWKGYSGEFTKGTVEKIKKLPKVCPFPL